MASQNPESISILVTLHLDPAEHDISDWPSHVIFKRTRNGNLCSAMCWGFLDQMMKLDMCNKGYQPLLVLNPSESSQVSWPKVGEVDPWLTQMWEIFVKFEPEHVKPLGNGFAMELQPESVRVTLRGKLVAPPPSINKPVNTENFEGKVTVEAGDLIFHAGRVHPDWDILQQELDALVKASEIQVNGMLSDGGAGDKPMLMLFDAEWAPVSPARS